MSRRLLNEAFHGKRLLARSEVLLRRNAAEAKLRERPPLGLKQKRGAVNSYHSRQQCLNLTGTEPNFYDT